MIDLRYILEVKVRWFNDSVNGCISGMGGRVVIVFFESVKCDFRVFGFRNCIIDIFINWDKDTVGKFSLVGDKEFGYVEFEVIVGN